MKRFLLLILLISVSCSKNKIQVNEPADLAYSIILIIGQSNTHSGIGLNSELDTTDDEIFQLGRFGADDMQIITASEPLQHHTKDDNKIGFGLTFAKLLKEFSNLPSPILIIPCGYGGTGFRDNHWNQGDFLYADAVNRVTTVIENNPESKLISILWHQGESDVGSPSYETDLDNFIVNIRNDLNAANVPFIVGGMVPFWVDQAVERTQQQQLIMTAVNRHNYIGYANPELPFRIEKQDNFIDAVHFDAEGQRELGKRYFNEYILLAE
ncbi:MAG: sialate O-acetylesterase [Flavobacteriaceae bacterium]|nr:sialate O-acetylesterase [Flavobacteriaceae bacterium]